MCLNEYFVFEATLTKAEKDMGLAIIDKLDSMMGWTGTPGIAFVPIRGAIKSEVASASGGSSGSAGSGGSRYQISQSAVTGTSGSFRHNVCETFAHLY